jgi:hypothetical protein
MAVDRPDWGPQGAGSSGTLPTLIDQRTDLDVSVANSVTNGVWTREEAQRHYGYTDDDMDRALAPPPSPASVQRQLAEIDRLRRTDKQRYFKDEALQKRERDLIAAREKLRAEALPAARSDSEYDGSALDKDLLATWERQGGVAFHLKTAQDTARAAMGALAPDEAQELMDSFDRLPVSAQTTVFGFLAIKPGAWRPANEGELAEFRESDLADLLEEWSDAPKKLGIVRGRLRMMLNSMKGADRSRAEAWLDSLPTSHAKAIFKALAG